MHTDIRFKHKGWFADYITYRNIENEKVSFELDLVIIEFDKTFKKDFLRPKTVTRHYRFVITKSQFVGVHIRRTEYE